jgi:N-acyl homoserine lactone hydrolase
MMGELRKERDLDCCRIHPIPLWISPSDTVNMLYLGRVGRSIGITGYVWYIEGSDKRILVDSGGSVERLARIGHLAYPLQTLEEGLGKHGLTFSDIELVVQTHLHADHSEFITSFPNAKVVVQKKELEFARQPHPLWAGLYDTDKLTDLDYLVVDGDADLAQGVKLLLTPGHTPGSQSVYIRTSAGKAVIAGLCSILANYAGVERPDGTRLPVTPAAIHTHLEEAYQSMVRIKEIADLILAPHDPAFLGGAPI